MLMVAWREIFSEIGDGGERREKNSGKQGVSVCVCVSKGILLSFQSLSFHFIAFYYYYLPLREKEP